MGKYSIFASKCRGLGLFETAETFAIVNAISEAIDPRVTSCVPPSGLRHFGTQRWRVAQAAGDEAELQAGGPLQKLSLPSGELEVGAAAHLSGAGVIAHICAMLL
jgi:hypothetical protein